MVTIHGTEYRLGAVVATGYINDLPTFAKILKIVVLSPENVHFVLKKITTIEFCEHFHAYQVEIPANADILISYESEFMTYLPAHLTKPYGSQNGTYIAPRFRVPES